MMRVGLYVFGLAALAAGIVDLVWGGLDPAHQPLQAWGDNVPGHRIIGYVLAVLLVAGGASMLYDRSARLGAGILAAVYGIFAFFWLPRFYTAPMVLGYKASVYLSVLAGFCSELIVVAAAVFVLAAASKSRSRRLLNAATAACLIFGLSSIVFGLAQITNIPPNLVYVPHWMPFGRTFWVVFTGIAFVLAGIAILWGLLDVLAARLLSLMWLVISAVTLIPGLAAAPHNQANWGGNAYNILAAASAWILADWLASRKESMQLRQASRPSTA
jgi:hypothetical protein